MNNVVLIWGHGLEVLNKYITATHSPVISSVFFFAREVLVIVNTTMHSVVLICGFARRRSA